VQRAVKVEAKFDGWEDISSKVKMAAGISVNRGRESEVDDPVAVGTVSLALDNSDGRFSPELASSPYFPYVVAGVPVRVSVYVSGAYRVRGYGRVQDWGTDPLSWYVAECSINAADALGSLPEYTFRSAADEVIRTTSGVVYHWPLREQPATALVGDVAGTDNGGGGWGEGSTLPLDEGDAHPKFTSASGGLTVTLLPLVVSPTYPWRLRFVLFGPPTANCNLIRYLSPSMTTPAQMISWNTSTGISGPGASVMPSSWPVVVEFGFVNSGSMPLRICEANGTVTTSAFAPGFNYQAQTKLWVNPTLSGDSVWSIGHLVLMSGAPDVTQLQTYAQALLASRLPVDAVSKVLTFAGGPTITGVPSSQISLPQLDGRDSADVLGAIAKGMGARMVDNLDGTLTWLPFAPSGSVVTLPAGFSPPRWGTDDRAWLSDCTVSWPDGTSYTATRADGPRRSDTIEAVHATPNGDRGMADWLVNSPTRARVTSVTYNLSAMSDANVLTVLGLTIGSRVTFPTMPAWIPSGLICIVEGFTESIESDAWTLTINLSPDVYSRLFILDDPVQGVLDGTYLLGP